MKKRDLRFDTFVPCPLGILPVRFLRDNLRFSVIELIRVQTDEPPIPVFVLLECYIGLIYRYIGNLIFDIGFKLIHIFL